MDSAYSAVEIAGAVLDAGQVSEALALLDAHLAQHPEDGDARRLRAAILARLPDGGAAALADLARLEPPTADDRRLRARLLREQKQFDAARALLEGLWRAQRDPRDAEFLLRVLLDQGDGKAALALLDELPDLWTWRVWRGDVCLSLHDHAAARRHYQAALADMPDAPLTRPLRVMLHERIALLSAGGGE